MFGLPNTKGGDKKSKKLTKNKRKNGSTTRMVIEDLDTQHNNEDEDSVKEYVESELAEDKLRISRKKKRKHVEGINKGDKLTKKNDACEQPDESKPEDHIAKSGGLNKADTTRNSRTGKSKKTGKRKQKSQSVPNELPPDTLMDTGGEDVEDEVYRMSSGDEDHSKGMKKWIMQYHQSRPGLNLLQERIDDFIAAHEAQEEQAKAEKETQAAEGGWTVVVHHKGRKKTTDGESGIAVGSVAQAAVLDKLAKKKNKEVGLDFYRFQKREAHRNELMMLQSKFEQDKKRIQQLRAARKFRPY